MNEWGALGWGRGRTSGHGRANAAAGGTHGRPSRHGSGTDPAGTPNGTTSSPNRFPSGPGGRRRSWGQAADEIPGRGTSSFMHQILGSRGSWNCAQIAVGPWLDGPTISWELLCRGAGTSTRISVAASADGRRPAIASFCGASLARGGRRTGLPLVGSRYRAKAPGGEMT